MTLLNICFVSLLSVTALFVSVKIIGNRQMSELNMFDYINGITIGSIAAEMATSLEGDFLKPLTAMAVYTAVVFIISVLNSKSIRVRRFVSGKCIALIYNGKFLPDNFKKGKVDLSEFLNQCRVQGYFNVGDIAYAFLEENGKISILPKTGSRPLMPKDLNTIGKDKGSPDNLSEASPYTTLIMDGQILQENLHHSGKDKTWLERKLSELKIGNIRDVFFAACDKSGDFIAFKRREDKGEGNDIFQ